MIQPFHRASVPPEPGGCRAFTLLELLVAVAVLAVVGLVLLNITESTSKVTSLSHRRMSADAGGREALDRFSLDLEHAVRRKDVPSLIEKKPGNDAVAFVAHAEGFDGDRGVSTVAYTVRNHMLHRGVEGSSWQSGAGTRQIAFGGSSLAPVPPENFDVLASDIFRFELAFLMKDGSLKTSVPGLVASPENPVQAVVVGVVALDKKARNTLTEDQMDELTSRYADAGDGRDHLQNWDQAQEGASLPPAVLNSIRVYQRYFYLR